MTVPESFSRRQRDVVEFAQARAAEAVAAGIAALERSVAAAPEWSRGWSNDGRYPRIEPTRAVLAGHLARLRGASDAPS